jgi:hypothetical protein
MMLRRIGTESYFYLSEDGHYKLIVRDDVTIPNVGEPSDALFLPRFLSSAEKMFNADDDDEGEEEGEEESE